jgi:hypothetical protein
MQPPPLTETESKNPSVMEVAELPDLHQFRIDVGAWRVRNPTGITLATSQHMKGLIHSRQTHDIWPHAQSTKGMLGRPHLS